jgi:hypothetical protein
VKERKRVRECEIDRLRERERERERERVRGCKRFSFADRLDKIIQPISDF